MMKVHGFKCWVLVGLFLLAVMPSALLAQEVVAEENVNMVSGTFVENSDDGSIEYYGGDEFLQKQNEPSIAASSRNPLHLLGGANDYRTVDVEPGYAPPGSQTLNGQGDTWLGLFKSFDGGKTWQSGLLPGFPQQCYQADGSQSLNEDGTPFSHPLCGYSAGADPTIRAGTNGLFYYSGIAFGRGDTNNGVVFVSTLID
ncbi:MAG: hypothetical protein JSU96_02925, partial [Acidobacteriota bacterium]